MVAHPDSLSVAGGRRAEIVKQYGVSDTFGTEISALCVAAH
jgi:hypothetical protein